MRSLGFRTHVLYALASSAGLLLSLGRPWYAPAPTSVPSDATVGELPDTISRFVDRLSRVLTAGGDATGAQQLPTVGRLVGALAAILALCALGTLVRPLRRAAAGGVQVAALLALATVAVELVEQPGETRVGAWMALASALVGLLAALRLSAAPARRPIPATRRFESSAPPPRPAWDESVPPVF